MAMSKLEQLQKAVDAASDIYDAAWGDPEPAAWAAFCKARQELKDYKMEHGL
jgi:hypothetical protein